MAKLGQGIIEGSPINSKAKGTNEGSSVDSDDRDGQMIQLQLDRIIVQFK